MMRCVGNGLIGLGMIGVLDVIHIASSWASKLHDNAILIRLITLNNGHPSFHAKINSRAFP